MTTMDLLRPLSELAESEPRSRRSSRFPLIHEELEARELLSVGQAVVGEPATELIAPGATAHPGQVATTIGNLEAGLTGQTTAASPLPLVQLGLPPTVTIDNAGLAEPRPAAAPLKLRLINCR